MSKLPIVPRMDNGLLGISSNLDLLMAISFYTHDCSNLKQWIHINCDDPNNINICSLCSFKTTNNKTLNPYNFCIQHPNNAFFGELESSCMYQSEFLKYFQV
jgi:hypothetical protein